MVITEEYIKIAQDLNPDLCPGLVRKLLEGFPASYKIRMAECKDVEVIYDVA